jgi:hypothetical protein
MQPIEIENCEIDLAELKAAVKKVDERFEQNISIRKPLEDKWNDYIKLAIDGEEGSRVVNLAKAYVNLSNPYYTSSWRQESAYSMSWLDGDFFDLTPPETMSNILDTSLCNAVKQKIRKAFNNPVSKFNRSTELVDLQCRLLNVSALAYSFEQMVEHEKTKTLEIENGKVRIKKQEGIPKLRYQGGVAHYVSMYDCYPDVLSPKSKDINDCDLYLKSAVSLDDLKDSPKFNASEEYTHQDFVIFRDNCCLSEIENAQYKLTDSERALEQKISSDVTHSESGFKGYCELRTAYLEKFCVNKGGQRETYHNVILIYAKSNNEICPLLLEYNYYPNGKRNVFLVEQQTNPWGMFGKSQKALAYNQACWLNFIRASQAYAVGKSTFRTRFVPAQLYKAAMDVGASKKDIEMGLRGAGYDIPYDISTYSQGASGLWSPEDNFETRDYQAMDAEISKVINDLNSINIDLQGGDVAASTAKGVGFIETKQAALFKKYLRNFADSILKPFIELFIDDLCLLIYDEVIATDIDNDRLAELNPDIEHLTQVFRATGQELTQEKVITIGQEGIPVVMGTKINPILKKEYITLTKNLLQDFRASVEVSIEGNEYDKQQLKADNLELMNLVQGMADGAGKDEALALTVEEYLDLRSNKNKNKYMKVLEAQRQEKEAQAQMQQAEAQKMQMDAEANAMSKQATAQKQQAEAAKIGQEVQANEAAMQLVGVG